jgi:tubby-related protein 1
MQFGKAGDHVFNLDVAYPCSIFQAFAIALASLDFKISSE